MRHWSDAGLGIEAHTPASHRKIYVPISQLLCCWCVLQVGPSLVDVSVLATPHGCGVSLSEAWHCYCLHYPQRMTGPIYHQHQADTKCSDTVACILLKLSYWTALVSHLTTSTLTHTITYDTMYFLLTDWLCNRKMQPPDAKYMLLSASSTTK